MATRTLAMKAVVIDTTTSIAMASQQATTTTLATTTLSTERTIQMAIRSTKIKTKELALTQTSRVESQTVTNKLMTAVERR